MPAGTVIRWLHRALSALWLAAPPPSVAPLDSPLDSDRSHPMWQISVTIDDVPMTGASSCRPEEILAVTEALLGHLARHDVPATAFVLPGTTCQGKGAASALAIARRWREAGHIIGNHSATHPDYNTTSITDYRRDLDRADRALAGLLEATSQRERWFRAPQLHMGTTAAAHRALGEWMAELGYRNGVVTIDNQEWIFAAAYRNHRDDPVQARRIVAAYLEHIDAAITYSRSAALTLFGHDIPLVLLLHANPLNADHLGGVLGRITEQGGKFVSLGEAMSDPAYASTEEYIGPRGLSWLHRWGLERGMELPAEPREPAWIRDLATGSASPQRHF